MLTLFAIFPFVWLCFGSFRIVFTHGSFSGRIFYFPSFAADFETVFRGISVFRRFVGCFGSLLGRFSVDFPFFAIFRGIFGCLETFMGQFFSGITIP
jgi:hypothetical protein